MPKYRGYRAIIARNTTGSTYVTVGQILEYGEIGSTREQIDVTAHGDEWMDFLAGRQEGTEFTMRIAYDPADTQHIALKTDYDTGTVKKYHLTHPDITGVNTGLEISMVPTGWVARSPMDGAYEAEATFKIVNPGVVLITTP